MIASKHRAGGAVLALLLGAAPFGYGQSNCSAVNGFRSSRASFLNARVAEARAAVADRRPVRDERLAQVTECCLQYLAPNNPTVEEVSFCVTATLARADNCLLWLEQDPGGDHDGLVNTVNGAIDSIGGLVRGYPELCRELLDRQLRLQWGRYAKVPKEKKAYPNLEGPRVLNDIQLRLQALDRSDLLQRQISAWDEQSGFTRTCDAWRSGLEQDLATLHLATPQLVPDPDSDPDWWIAAPPAVARVRTVASISGSWLSTSTRRAIQELEPRVSALAARLTSSSELLLQDLTASSRPSTPGPTACFNEIVEDIARLDRRASSLKRVLLAWNTAKLGAGEDLGLPVTARLDSLSRMSQATQQIAAELRTQPAGSRNWAGITLSPPAATATLPDRLQGALVAFVAMKRDETDRLQRAGRKLRALRDDFTRVPRDITAAIPIVQAAIKNLDELRQMVAPQARLFCEQGSVFTAFESQEQLADESGDSRAYLTELEKALTTLSLYWQQKPIEDRPDGRKEPFPNNGYSQWLGQSQPQWISNLADAASLSAMSTRKLERFRGALDHLCNGGGPVATEPWEIDLARATTWEELLAALDKGISAMDSLSFPEEDRIGKEARRVFSMRLGTLRGQVKQKALKVQELSDRVSKVFASRIETWADQLPGIARSLEEVCNPEARRVCPREIAMVSRLRDLLTHAQARADLAARVNKTNASQQAVDFATWDSFLKGWTSLNRALETADWAALASQLGLESDSGRSWSRLLDTINSNVNHARCTSEASACLQRLSVSRLAQDALDLKNNRFAGAEADFWGNVPPDCSERFQAMLNKRHWLWNALHNATIEFDRLADVPLDTLSVAQISETRTEITSCLHALGVARSNLETGPATVSPEDAPDSIRLYQRLGELSTRAREIEAYAGECQALVRRPPRDRVEPRRPRTPNSGPVEGYSDTLEQSLATVENKLVDIASRLMNSKLALQNLTLGQLKRSEARTQYPDLLLRIIVKDKDSEWTHLSDAAIRELSQSRSIPPTWQPEVLFGTEPALPAAPSTTTASSVAAVEPPSLRGSDTERQPVALEDELTHEQWRKELKRVEGELLQTKRWDCSPRRLELLLSWSFGTETAFYALPYGAPRNCSDFPKYVEIVLRKLIERPGGRKSSFVRLLERFLCYHGVVGEQGLLTRYQFDEADRTVAAALASARALPADELVKKMKLELRCDASTYSQWRLVWHFYEGGKPLPANSDETSAIIPAPYKVVTSPPAIATPPTSTLRSTDFTILLNAISSKPGYVQADRLETLLFARLVVGEFKKEEWEALDATRVRRLLQFIYCAYQLSRDPVLSQLSPMNREFLKMTGSIAANVLGFESQTPRDVAALDEYVIQVLRTRLHSGVTIWSEHSLDDRTAVYPALRRFLMICAQFDINLRADANAQADYANRMAHEAQARSMSPQKIE